jgi:hypothetical protein
MAVFSADGERIGTLKSGTAHNGYLLMHQGRIFGHDFYLPQELIASVDASGIHLRASKNEVEKYMRSEPPAAPPPASQGSDIVVGSAHPVGPDQPAAELHRTAPLWEPGHPPTDLAATPTGEPGAPAPSSGGTESPPPAHLENAAAGAAAGIAAQAGQIANQAQQQAGAIAERAGQQAEQLADQAQQQAGQLASQAQEQAGQLAAGIRDQVGQQAATQMAHAASGLDGLSATLTQLSAQLKSNNLNELAHYADDAASQVSALSRRLHEMTPDDLVGELQLLVREHPEVLSAIVVGIGILVERLLGSRRQSNTDQNTDQR